MSGVSQTPFCPIGNLILHVNADTSIYYDNNEPNSILPELGAFDDIGDGIFEPVSHVFSLPLAIRSTKDASRFGYVFLRQILFVILS